MSIISLNDQDIADRLKEVMKEKRMKSERAFALSINADPSYFSKVIKCKRSISEKMVDAIQEEYNINPDWLLWGKGQKYGQNTPHEVQNNLVLTPPEPDTGIKYIALLEKTLQEKEADLKTMRAAFTKITDTDKRVSKLETTVDELQDKFSNLDPIVLGLQEFVTEELAGLKKISREAVAAALGSKVAAYRKKV